MQNKQDSKQDRDRLNSSVVAGDVLSTLQEARTLLRSKKSSDIAFCAQTFKRLEPELLAHGHRLLKTYIVRNVTVEPLLPALQVQAVLNGYVLRLEVGGYGSYMNDMLDPSGDLATATPDLVFVLLDMDEMAGQLANVCARGLQREVDVEIDASIDRFHRLLQGFRSGQRAKLVLTGCVLPNVTSLGPAGESNARSSLQRAIHQLNDRLADLCRSIPDCAFCDLDRIAGDHGRSQWRDERLFLSTRLPISPSAFFSYTQGLMRVASALFRAPRKVLCTDLDNTLWGGVLGEDGPEGILTGAAFPGNCYFEYQTYLKQLAARGILLALVSKNNPDDVAEAFRLRGADLAVNLSDFVSHRIGWGDKVEALSEVANELSLGIDSLVFVDDSDVECDAVRQRLPQVEVVQVPVTEPWRLNEMLANSWFFDTLTITSDDHNRSSEYKAQIQRQVLQENTTSREDFLRSLGIVCTFIDVQQAPLARVVQLLAKTNQFNLTTRRHSATEVLAFDSDPICEAIAVRVRDRFGDAGVVGLALTRAKSDCCFIDTLLLSCRVIGRGIEAAILERMASRATLAGCRWLIGEYIRTPKNAPCQNFFTEHGFEKVADQSSDIHTVYRLDITSNQPATPSWIAIQEEEKDEPRDSAPRSA